MVSARARNSWVWVIALAFFASVLTQTATVHAQPQGAGWTTTGDLNSVSGAYKTNGIKRISSDGVSTLTQVNAGNLRLEGNKISSTNENGNMILLPADLGNVGIGTTSPQTMLHIDSGRTNHVTGRLSFKNHQLGFGMLDFFDTTNGKDRWQLGVSSPNYNDGLLSGNAFWIFQMVDSGGTTRNRYAFTINDGGNVGISTTTPQAPLHVAGDVTATGGIYTGGSNSAKGTQRIDASGNGTLGTIASTGNITVGTDGGGGRSITINTDLAGKAMTIGGNQYISSITAPDVTALILQSGNYLSLKTGWDLHFYSGNNFNFIDNTTGAPVRVTINHASGNINNISGAYQTNGTTRIGSDGSGTFTQANAGNLSLSGNTLASTNTDGNILISPAGAGKVGIGTNTPEFPLQTVRDMGVSAGAKYLAWIGRTLSTGPGLLIGYYGNGSSVSGQFIRTAGASNPLYLGTYGSTQAVSILDNGNVGIGTTNPTNKLHVEGGSGGGNNALGYLGYAGSNQTASVLIENRGAAVGDGAQLSIYSGTGGGNAWTVYKNSRDNQFWSTGIASANNGSYKISGSYALGTADYLILDRSGNLNLAAGALQTSGTTRLTATGAATLTQADVDNLRLDGNTISSTNTNGDIAITPNGTGNTIINGTNGLTVKSPDASKSAGLTVDNSGTTVLSSTNAVLRLYSPSYTWISTAANQNIYMDYGGTMFFRDVDGSYAQRLTIESSTGDINNIAGAYKTNGTTRIDASGNVTAATATVGGSKNWGKLSAAPASPAEGDEYYNTATHKKYCYDGTTWQACW